MIILDNEFIEFVGGGVRLFNGKVSERYEHFTIVFRLA